MEGNAETSGIHHRDVVGPVPGGDDLVRRKAQRITDTHEVRRLGLAVDDGADHAAGEVAVDDFQLVREGMVEAQTRLQALGEVGEAAGHQHAADTRAPGVPA